MLVGRRCDEGYIRVYNEIRQINMDSKTVIRINLPNLAICVYKILFYNKRMSESMVLFTNSPLLLYVSERTIP